jgi:hypothetical protein
VQNARILLRSIIFPKTLQRTRRAERCATADNLILTRRAMRKHLLRTAAALTLALLGGVGFAAAQSQTTQQPEAKDPTPAQVAPAKPKAETAPQTGPAFVNGALDAPGADKNASTVPAKFSAKNDAEDHLPLMAFTFKNLSDEQRRVIVQGVKDAKTAAPNGAANPDFYANVGVQVQSAVDLRALPDEVTAKIPQTRAYRYTTVGDKVLLVEPANRTVVAVIKE